MDSKRVFYVRIRDITSTKPTAAGSLRSLKDFARSFEVGSPGEGLVFFDLTFSDKYLVIFSRKYGQGTVTPFFILWKRIEEIKDDAPFSKMDLNSQPEFGADVWNQRSFLVVGDLVYLSLSVRPNQALSQIGTKKFGLACFKINPTVQTLTKISSLMYNFDGTDLILVPRTLDYQLSSPQVFLSLISVKSRVFAVTNVSLSKFCIRIHCFHKSQILSIGGGMRHSPGTYVLQQDAQFQLLVRDSRTLGYFGYQKRQNTQMKHDLLTVFRYILV